MLQTILLDKLWFLDMVEVLNLNQQEVFLLIHYLESTLMIGVVCVQPTPRTKTTATPPSPAGELMLRLGILAAISLLLCTPMASMVSPVSAFTVMPISWDREIPT